MSWWKRPFSQREFWWSCEVGHLLVSGGPFSSQDECDRDRAKHEASHDQPSAAPSEEPVIESMPETPSPPPAPRKPVVEVVDVPPAGWRHEYLRSVTRERCDGSWVAPPKYELVDGLAEQPEPSRPDEWEIERDVFPSDQGWRAYTEQCDRREQRRTEFDVVLRAWMVARLTLDLKRTMLELTPNYGSAPDLDRLWTEYTATRRELVDGYKALSTTETARWNTAVLRIHDAQQPARRAADAWDDVACKLVHRWAFVEKRLEDKDAREVFAHVWATQHRVKTARSWEFGDPYAYRGDRLVGSLLPARGGIEDVIRTGDARIEGVSKLLAGAGG